MSEFEIERRCVFEKRPGIVELSATQLVWTPNSAADGRELRVPFTAISQFQVSKEGSAKKAMIRLTCSDRPNKITLDFATSITDRDAVHDLLNRLQSAPPPAPPPPMHLPPAQPLTAKQRAWVAALLKRTEVRQMHARLVLSGAVPEHVFWKGMKFRYTPKAEPRNPTEPLEHADLVDQTVVPSDSFVASTSCDDLKWDTVPTPAQCNHIFVPFPAVKRAFLQKKAAFDDRHLWALFAASSMAPRSARVRSKRDTDLAGEADAFFAPYQVREAGRAQNSATKPCVTFIQILLLTASTTIELNMCTTSTRRRELAFRTLYA